MVSRVVQASFVLQDLENVKQPQHQPTPGADQPRGAGASSREEPITTIRVVSNGHTVRAKQPLPPRWVRVDWRLFYCLVCNAPVGHDKEKKKFLGKRLSIVIFVKPVTADASRNLKGVPIIGHGVN